MSQPLSKQLTAKEVTDLHRNADTDTRKEALHHTLGPNSNQASPGTHTHNGTDSAKLLDGVTISGDRSDGTALMSVIQALEKLGATNATVA